MRQHLPFHAEPEIVPDLESWPITAALNNTAGSQVIAWNVQTVRSCAA
jgi:hypothetical protein